MVRYEVLLQFHFAWLEDLYHQQKLEPVGEMDPDEHLVLAVGAPFFQRSSTRTTPRGGGSGMCDISTPMISTPTPLASSSAGKRRLVLDMHRHLDLHVIPAGEG